MKNSQAQQRAPQKPVDMEDRPLNNGKSNQPQQKIDIEDRPLDLKGNKMPN